MQVAVVEVVFLTVLCIAACVALGFAVWWLLAKVGFISKPLPECSWTRYCCAPRKEEDAEEDEERNPLMATKRYSSRAALHVGQPSECGLLATNFEKEPFSEKATHMYSWTSKTFAKRDSRGKILLYDIDKATGWEALFHRSGTSLAEPILWKTCSVYWAITACFAVAFYVMHWVEGKGYGVSKVLRSMDIDSDRNLEHIATVTTYTTALLGFMLGMFVTTIVNRWWKMRTQGGVGALWSAINDIMMFLSVRMPGPEDAVHKETILRLLLAVHRLVFIEARELRDDAELERMVEVGLLLPEEEQCLRAVAQGACAQVVLVWVNRYYKLLAKQEKWFTVKDSRQLDLFIYRARDAISDVFAYCRTQLPFQYVHLLTFTVILSNLLVAVKCGVAIGKSIAPDTPSDCVYSCTQVFHVFFVPFSYHAFLRLCSELSNPFGTDFMDFPGFAFHCDIRSEGFAIHKAGELAPPGLMALGSGGSLKGT